MSWKGRRRNESCGLVDKGFEWQKAMEHLLAYHVVKLQCQGLTPCDSCPQSLPPKSTQVDGLIRVCVYLSLSGCSFYELGICKAYLAGTE